MWAGGFRAEGRDRADAYTLTVKDKNILICPAINDWRQEALCLRVVVRPSVRQHLFRVTSLYSVEAF